MNAAGAKALRQDRAGGSTLTVAKNIKQLGLDMLLLGSVDDLAVFKPAGEVLGEHFMFVARAGAGSTRRCRTARSSRRSGASCRSGAPSTASATPDWAGKGMGRDDGHRRRDREGARASRDRRCATRSETISGFQGTGGVYNFSPTVHQGITQNPFLLGTIAGGKMQVKQ